MKTVAITSVKFESETGECIPDLEAALVELTKKIEYEARQIARTFDLTFEIEEN